MHVIGADELFNKSGRSAHIVVIEHQPTRKARAAGTNDQVEEGCLLDARPAIAAQGEIGLSSICVERNTN